MDLQREHHQLSGLPWTLGVWIRACDSEQLVCTRQANSWPHPPRWQTGCGPWQGALVILPPLYPLNKRAARKSELLYSQITKSNKHVFLLCDTPGGLITCLAADDSLHYKHLSKRCWVFCARHLWYMVLGKERKEFGGHISGGTNV